MGASYRLYVLGVLLSATTASLGCGNADSTALAMPAQAPAVNLAVEPAEIAPEFIPGAACAAHPPFDLQFFLGLTAPDDVFFRQVRFRFEDRFGRVGVPQVTLRFGAPPPPSSLPNSSPVPIPSASPIPIPSATTLPGAVTAFGDVRRLPLGLRFDCGIAGSGTLIVIVDFDSHGRSLSTETRVPVR